MIDDPAVAHPGNRELNIYSADATTRRSPCTSCDGLSQPLSSRHSRAIPLCGQARHALCYVVCRSLPESGIVIDAGTARSESAVAGRAQFSRLALPALLLLKAAHSQRDTVPA